MFRRAIVATIILSQMALLADVAEARCRFRRARRRVCYKQIEYRREVLQTCTVTCKCTPNNGGPPYYISAMATTCAQAKHLVENQCSGTLSDCREVMSEIVIEVPVGMRPAIWRVTYVCQTQKGQTVVATAELPGYQNAVNYAWSLVRKLGAEQGGLCKCQGTAQRVH
jgi:hypothetical protein